MMGAVVGAIGVIALLFIGYGVIMTAQNFGNAANATYVPTAAQNAGMNADASFSMVNVAFALLGIGALITVGFAIVMALT